jgi:hypothetical protein
MYKSRKQQQLSFDNDGVKTIIIKELFGTITEIHSDYKEKFNQNYSDLIGKDFVCFEDQFVYENLKLNKTDRWIQLRDCELLNGKKLNITVKVKRSENFSEYYV